MEQVLALKFVSSTFCAHWLGIIARVSVRGLRRGLGSDTPEEHLQCFFY